MKAWAMPYLGERHAVLVAMTMRLQVHLNQSCLAALVVSRRGQLRVELMHCWGKAGLHRCKNSHHRARHQAVPVLQW